MSNERNDAAKFMEYRNLLKGRMIKIATYISKEILNYQYSYVDYLAVTWNIDLSPFKNIHITISWFQSEQEFQCFIENGTFPIKNRNKNPIICLKQAIKDYHSDISEKVKILEGFIDAIKV